MSDCTPLKRCSKCKQEFPATPEYFVRNASKSGGLDSVCHTCNRERTKAWRKNNTEFYNAQRRKYVRENHERIMSHKRRWADGNPENIRKNKRLSEARRKTRKKGLPDNFTAHDWQICLEYWGYRCAACGKPIGLWHSLAPDHWIPIASPDCPGNIPNNVIPLCHGQGGCNNSKKNKHPVQWLVERFGKRKAKAILERIEAYFQVVRDKETHE